MITQNQWESYANIVNGAHEFFNQDTVTWYRFTRKLSRYNEDEEDTNYEGIPLKCLIQYNVFRTWPMTKTTVGGDIDNESIVMILNLKYLNDNGYLNSDGIFDMTPGRDYFVHRGITYRSGGDTPVSQANSNPLLFYIILSREEINTGDNKY